jgi:crossover junction endodeoxyribonuclease RuvC
MTILGIDFSLTATGVCAITDGEPECVTITSKPEQSWWDFPNRVERIAVQIHDWMGDDRLGAFVVIESPAFGARGSAVDRMFGGWWLMVRTLGRLGYDEPLKVAPGQLKKFATGNGNASKTDVVLAVERRYPDARISGDDEADAVVLAAIGAAAYGEPFGPLTKVQSEIVAAVVAGKER